MERSTSLPCLISSGYILPKAVAAAWRTAGSSSLRRDSNSESIILPCLTNSGYILPKAVAAAWRTAQSSSLRRDSNSMRHNMALRDASFLASPSAIARNSAGVFSFFCIIPGGSMSGDFGSSISTLRAFPFGPDNVSGCFPASRPTRSANPFSAPATAASAFSLSPAFSPVTQAACV